MMKKLNPPARASATAAPTSASEPKETEHVSNLWTLFTTVPRPHRAVPMPRNLPGTDEPIAMGAMWPLRQSEIMEASAAAESFLRTQLFKDEESRKSVAYQHSFANELAVQQLWRACRDPEDVTKPAFPSPKALRLNTDSDEIGVLYNHYLSTQAELGPITATLGDEEYEQIVRRIQEDAAYDPFALLSWEALRTLVFSMASDLASYWTATSSPGPQPDDGTSKPSDESTNESSETITSADGVDAASE